MDPFVPDIDTHIPNLLISFENDLVQRICTENPIYHRMNSVLNHVFIWRPDMAYYGFVNAVLSAFHLTPNPFPCSIRLQLGDVLEVMATPCTKWGSEFYASIGGYCYWRNLWLVQPQEGKNWTSVQKKKERVGSISSNEDSRSLSTQTWRTRANTVV